MYRSEKISIRVEHAMFTMYLNLKEAHVPARAIGKKMGS